MESRTHDKVGLPQRLWSGRVWPVLAGIVTAVGVLAASTMVGILAVLGIYALLSLFALVTVWGVASEFGIDRPLVLRLGLYGALVVVALVGLSEIHPQYGPLVAVALGLTSPAALDLVTRTRLRKTRCLADEPVPGVLLDAAILNRRFDDIVSQLKESGEFPSW